MIPVAANPCLAHGCSECCMDTEMPLLVEDIERLEGLGHARDAFAMRAPEGNWQLRTVDPAEGQTKRPCYFLKEGQCGVYQHRPVGCRIYPMVLNPQGRLLRDEDCPHRAEFPIDVSAKRRILKISAQAQRETRELMRGGR